MEAFTGEQPKVYSIAIVFHLPRCSRTHAAFKKTLSSSLLAGNRVFRQKQLPWVTRKNLKAHFNKCLLAGGRCHFVLQNWSTGSNRRSQDQNQWNNWIKILSIGKGWNGNKPKTPFLVLRKSSWQFWNSALSQLPLVYILDCKSHH